MALPPRQDGRADHRHQDRAPAARPAPPTCGRPCSSRSSPISGRSAPSCEPAPTRPRTTRPTPWRRATPRFRVAERLLLTGHSPPGLARRGARRRRSRPSTTRPSWSTPSGSAPSRRPTGCAGWLRGWLGDAARRDRPRAQHPRPGGPLPVRARPARAGRGWSPPTASSTPLRRQLARLAEAGVEVVRVPARPAATLAERLAARGRRPHGAGARLRGALRARGASCPASARSPRACDRARRRLLVDAYHALGRAAGSRWRRRACSRAPGWSAAATSTCSSARATASCACPPGAASLRPVDHRLVRGVRRPRRRARSGEVGYGPRAPTRFAGSTYDPTSHYRAARVLDFFAREGLTPVSCAR